MKLIFIFNELNELIFFEQMNNCELNNYGKYILRMCLHCKIYIYIYIYIYYLFFFTHFFFFQINLDNSRGSDKIIF